MIRRRGVLAGAGAAAAAGLLPVGVPAFAQSTLPSLRIAAVKFGSLNWLLDTIRHEGLDTKAGVKLDIVEVATNQAGPIALMAGDVDLIVSDWTWALRQRSRGEPLKFSPYSSALGALMVPKDSPVKTLADLEGKKLGVAGSAIDKSWLLMRAYSRKMLGKDLSSMASPMYGAAPLLTEEIRNGRLDAVLNFWTFAARLAGDGYVELVRMSEVLKALGIEPVPTLVGFIWNEKTEADKGVARTAFFKAVAEANALLQSSDAAWDRLRPLVKPSSDAELGAIKAFYRNGVPGPWRDAETRSAENLVKLLIEVGDEELVGTNTHFDAKLFHVTG